MGLDSSDRPRLVEGARRAHEQLAKTLPGLTEVQVREPSRLLGWTRGHLLTHLARNADSHIRLLTAAQRSELVEQYEGGQKGRAEAIDRGAVRDLATLVQDTLGSSLRLMALWSDLPDDVWERPVGTNWGSQPAWRLVWSRWRELEIHHVDLDLGYEPQDWPDPFVGVMLAEALETLAPRVLAGCTVKVQATATPDGPTQVERLIAGEAQLSPAPNPDAQSSVTASGTTADVLAWLLGRTTAMTPNLQFTDGEGTPTPAPALLPWG